MSKATLGVIVGNRDFFPDHLVTEARAEIVALFKKLDIVPIMLDETATKLGGVEAYQDAKVCAELFKKHRDSIEGVLVVLPNFGDERGVLDTMKLSGLDVPVLIQASPDDLNKLSPALRRDGLCGKISVCNNLRQAGIPYSLTSKHVMSLQDEAFHKDLVDFVSVCRVVNGLKNARIGAIGARPGAFNTVRYSEKLLQEYGINVVTVDLSQIWGDFDRLSNSDPAAKKSLETIKAFANYDKVPEEKLMSMAKLDAVINRFVEENGLNATAIQCWNSLQMNFGINVCTSMSMMSEKLIPSACEVDVMGALSMYALQLASGRPSALADWNNNYGGEPDKVVMFHCGNWAKSFIPDIKISTAPILGSTLGEENTYGAMEGRTPAGPLTYARLSTDDSVGLINAYVGEGDFTNDPLDTFGSRAVANIPNIEGLLKHICENGFEHHVAMNVSHTAGVLSEAFSNYLGWEVYNHQ